MHRMRLSIFAMATLLLGAGIARGQEEQQLATRLTFDFADAAQLEAFRESSGQIAQYPHRAEAGIGADAGLIAVLNDGSKDDGLFLVQQTVNLRRQEVTLSLYFRADGTNGKGTSRIFVGFADSPQTNLAKGDAKIGVRLFKPASPADPQSAWVPQLVNGVATRDLGPRFALADGQWYRLTATMGLTDEGRAIRYTAEVQQVNANGGETEGTSQGANGVTRDLGSYNLRQMHVAIFAQNNNGGATAIDNLSIEIVDRSDGRSEQAVLEEVLFPPPPMPDLRAPQQTMFGACGHFMHTPLFYRDGSKSPYWQLEYTLPLLLQANLGWVREPLYQPWFDDPDNPRAMENRKTVERYLQMYQDHGVRVILVPLAVGPNDAKHGAFREGYFQWIGDLAARFSCVRVIEMHNEPNLKYFWQGTAQDYVTIYRDGAAAIRHRAPEVTIAVGSISSLWWEPGIEWLKVVLDAGALEWADAVAVHPYNKRFAPEADPHFAEGSPEDPDHLERAIHAFNALVQSHAPEGKQVKLYFTELGYSSGVEGMAALGDETLQADYLSRLMLTYLAVRLDGVPLEAVTWYDFKNDGRNDHAESNFGLVGYDTSRVKPAYEVYRRIAGFFDDPSRLEKLSVEAASSNWPDVVRHHAWRRDDGAVIVPVWRLDQRQAKDVDFATELTISMGQSVAIKRVVWHSLHEQTPREIGFAVGDGVLRVPVWLTRRAAWLEIIPEGSGEGGAR